MKRKHKKLVHKNKIILTVAVMIGAVVIGFTGKLAEREAEANIAPTVNVTRIVQPKAIDQIPTSRGTLREITMYTSREAETDSTPCISADGTDICKVNYNVCASNAHKIGQRLEIKGLGECIVKDRMNSRYKNSIDWYAKFDLERALKFGRQKLEVVEL